MGKSTISMVMFNSYVTNYQRVIHICFKSLVVLDIPYMESMEFRRTPAKLPEFGRVSEYETQQNHLLLSTKEG